LLDLTPILDAKHKYSWTIVFGDINKNPEICGPWKKYDQTNEQLKELYEKVKSHAHNWGPITGNGLLAFDFDWPWIFGLWIYHFKPRSDTLIIETPNGGARVFYHTNEISPGDPFKESLHLEIKTNHYVAAGGEALTQDGDVKPYIIHQDNDIKTDNEIIGDTVEYFETLLETRYAWLHYHCVSNHLSKCKKRITLPHETGLSIANFMMSNGCEDWEIHNFRKAVYDFKDNKYVTEYDERKTQRQIESTRKYLEKKGKPPTCKTLLNTFNMDKETCKGCPRKQEAKEKTMFKSVDFIKDLLATTQMKTIETSTSSDTIWRYHDEGGIWIEDGIPFIEKKLKDLLGDKLKPRHLTETIRITKVYTYCKQEDFTEDPGSIPLQNGEYDFTLRTLIPFTPHHNHRNKLPIKYEPNTDCPTIKKFINEVAPGDEVTIQELFGYLLVKGYPIQKCFILQGSGANGKSTLLRLMEAFIGKENVSSVSLYDLVTKTFSKAELYNKLANITPDIGADELKRTGIFKALTGGDTITAERKNQHPFQFTNYAKMIFSCNQLPTSPDNSDAFFRRFMIFQFKQIFDDTRADRSLLDKLNTADELSGLFNHALEGYWRLMERMNFTESKSTLETKTLYLQMSDPLNSFLRDMAEEDPQAVTTKDELYRYYSEYCINKGFVSQSYVRFFMALKGRVYLQDAQETRIVDGRKKDIRVLKGIRVKIENIPAGNKNIPCPNNYDGQKSYPKNLENYPEFGGTTQATQPTQAIYTQEINLENSSDGNNVRGEYKQPVLPVLPVLPSKETESIVLRPNLDENYQLVAVNLRRRGPVHENDLSKGLGLPLEEVRRLLGVVQRDGHAFCTLGVWRWVP